MKPMTTEWVAKAEGDFVTLERESKVGTNPNYDGICFHAQQCAEKYFKARLCEAGESFGKIHRLNGRTGEEVWSYTLGSFAGVRQMSLIEDLNNDLIPDILIASSAENGLNCLSGLDGTQIWAHQMDFQYGVSAVPDIDFDGAQDVVTGDQTGTFYCISGKEDSLIFSMNFGDRVAQTHFPAVGPVGSERIASKNRSAKRIDMVII